MYGNAKFMTSERIDTHALEAQEETLRATRPLSTSRSRASRPASSPSPIRSRLHAGRTQGAGGGIEVIMLIDDNRTMATAIAKRLAILEVEAEVLPDQKSLVVSRNERLDGSSQLRKTASRPAGACCGGCRDRNGNGSGFAEHWRDFTVRRPWRYRPPACPSLSHHEQHRQNLFFAFI